MTTKLVELTPDECRLLLSTHRPRLGRLAFIAGGRAQVFPMNFLALDDLLYFRTGVGSKLLAALRIQEVTFELDHVDEVWREGWSVMAYGRLREVVEQDELDEISEQPLRPWAGGDRHHVLRMDIHELTGRRIV